MTGRLGMAMAAVLAIGCSDCRNKIRVMQMENSVECPAPAHPVKGTLELMLVDDRGNAEFFSEINVAAKSSPTVELGTEYPILIDGREVHPYYLTAQDPLAIELFINSTKVEVPDDHRIAIGRVSVADSDEPGWQTYYLVDEAVITEKHVDEASVSFNEWNQMPVVMVELTDEGAKAFEAFTGDHVKERLAILVDGEVVSAPVIQEKIPGGRIQITMGSFGSSDDVWCEAKTLADTLASK